MLPVVVVVVGLATLDIVSEKLVPPPTNVFRSTVSCVEVSMVQVEAMPESEQVLERMLMGEGKVTTIKDEVIKELTLTNQITYSVVTPRLLSVMVRSAEVILEGSATISTVPESIK